MTVFYTWPFPATGVTTGAKRTMAVRLADIPNVKEWGAVANGSTDDAGNIQSAIDYVINTLGGGMVFFPPGNYHLGTNLVVGSNTIDCGVSLVGSGKDCTQMSSGTISAGGRTHDCLARVEGLGGSFNVTATRDNAVVTDCRLGRVDFSGAIGASLSNCQMSGGGTCGNADSTNPTVTAGVVGVWLGTGCSVQNTRCQGGCDVAYALSGAGASLIECACEVCNTAVRVGWGLIGGVAQEVQAVGATVQCLQTERCLTAIDLYNCQSCFIAGNILTAGDGTSGHAATVTSATWNVAGANLVEFTCPAVHNLGANGTVITLQLEMDGSVIPSAYIPPATGFSGDQSGLIIATVTSTTKFTYPGVSSNPGSFTQAIWNRPPQYAIRCRKVYETTIVAQAVFGNVLATMASVDLDYGGAADHRNNNFQGIIAGSGTYGGWMLPSNLKNLAGWNFSNVGGVNSSYTAAVALPYPYMVFADLPGQSGVTQPGPFETQEYAIVDGAKSGGGAATWGDAVQGGSTGHYQVRYNGSNWVRIG